MSYKRLFGVTKSVILCHINRYLMSYRTLFDVISTVI